MKEDKSAMKQFGLSTWSINNVKTIILISVIITLGGYISYNAMPKEFFPEIQVPEVYVSTPYPGANSKFVRDNITEPFETELNSTKNVDKIQSTSSDGLSMIKIAFDFKVTPDEARDRVQRAVDQARTEPGFIELQFEPNVFVADVSEMPILNVNLSSDVYGPDKLEDYAKILKDKIKNLPEISDVDIRGVPEQKVIIELNRSKMAAKEISFGDIENAIGSENVNLPSGNLLIGTRKVSLKIDGEFKHFSELDSLIVKSEQGDEVFLSEISDTIFFGDADPTSFAREFGSNVVMLDIKKRAGQNLLEATDKIYEIVAARAGIPSEVNISITNEQAGKTRDGVSNLENSIIFGVILVVLVLLFFLGLRNALFVGIAIPLSMFMSFMILNAMGVTLNVMVLFSSVLALGMLVDNGIVVVENIYRLMDEGYSPIKAAKYGVGEVAWPIIASTATTLAAFVPLAFWPGMMGEFMKYLPITLIIVLGSSLFVALVINPVFTSLFMKIEEKEPRKKRLFLIASIIITLGVVTLMGGTIWFANVLFLIGGLILINLFIFRPGTRIFRNNFLPKLENGYKRFLTWALHGRRPGFLFLSMFGLLFMSFFLIGAFPPKTLLFPENEPAYLNIFIEHPVGTDIYETDKTAQKVYDIVNDEIYAKYKDKTQKKWTVNDNGEKVQVDEPIIKSIISQTGMGSGDPAQGPSLNESPNKARITVQFAEAQYRGPYKSSDIKREVEAALEGQFPAGVKVTVDKDAAGPPQELPINIEIKGPGDYGKTLEYADSLLKFLKQPRWVKKHPEWKELVELKMDVETNKLELPIELDRKTLRDMGVSTYQVASMMRTALFGKDVSIYKYDGDSYDINLRLAESERNNLDALMSMEIVFRNTRGQIVSIPIRSVVKQKKNTIYSTYGSVKRKDGHDLVRIQSKLKREDVAGDIVKQMTEAIKEFEKTPIGQEMMAAGYTYEFTGGQAEQAEQMEFLQTALLIAVFLILLIIVTQFNSFRTPAIIMFAVVFSFIGVLLGLVTFRQDFVIMMTMIGIISLAGVVVNNAIVLIDYTNLIRQRKREEKGLSENHVDSIPDIIESLVEGGQTRLRPVLLTAITTVLGLIPLATGFNINFVTLFTDYDPQIYIGGDNSIFFGPMSWTIIYGLTFATFLTLVIVPVAYLLLFKFKAWLYRLFGSEMRGGL